MSRFIVALLGTLVLLMGCTMIAPLATPNVCDYIRARVENGSIPLSYAREHYPDCAPYEVSDES
jgi:hypothetical protein